MQLKLYMKSGNIVLIDHVDDWRIEYSGDSIVSLNVTWAKSKEAGKGVVIASLALCQIEAIEAL